MSSDGLWGGALSPSILTAGCVGKGALFCSAPVVQIWDCGDVSGGVNVCGKVSWNCRILVELESTQTAFNCPLFFLVSLPASPALVLVPRPHHHLQTASARVEPWKALEPWEGTRPPSTEETQGGILAPTSAADTNRVKLSPVHAPKEEILAGHTGFNLGGRGDVLKIVN